MRFLVLLALGAVCCVPGRAQTPAPNHAAILAHTLQNLATISDPNVRALLTAAVKEKDVTIVDFPVLARDGKTFICIGYINYYGQTRIYRMKGNKAERVPYRAPKSNSGTYGDYDYIEPQSAAFSPDGRFLATTRPCTVSNRGYERRELAAVSLFDARTFQLVRTFPAQSNSISSLAFSHDGKRLLAGNAGGGAAIYDVASGKVLKQWHFKNVFKSLLVSFAQTPDGEKAVALTLNPYEGGYSGTADQEKAARAEAAQLWDVEADMLLADFPQAKDVGHAAFSSDGLKIAMVGGVFFDDKNIPRSKLLIVDWNSDAQLYKETVAEGEFSRSSILWTPHDEDVIYVGPGLAHLLFYVVPASR